MPLRFRAAVLRLAVLAVLASGGCSPLIVPLPPPPGALFLWSHVSVSDVPASRPLMPATATWDALLYGTPPGGADCDDAACRRDPLGWIAQCVQPRALAMAAEQARVLKARDQWHAQALATLATTALPAVVDTDACGGAWIHQQVAGSILRALGERARAEQAAACPARAAQVTFGLHEIDRGRESFGQWLRHDYPAVVGAAFVGILTGATVVPMGDVVSRIATLDLRLEDDQGNVTTIAVRGAASVKLGSIKAFERDTPLPPELAPVALVATLARADERLAAWVSAGCRPTP
jgi:hypothetical protein